MSVLTEPLTTFTMTDDNTIPIRNPSLGDEKQERKRNESIVSETVQGGPTRHDEQQCKLGASNENSMGHLQECCNSPVRQWTIDKRFVLGVRISQ
jgi:hypothetical protein